MSEQILDQLTDQRQFSFGEPWRLNEKSLTIVVPILKKGESGTRNYYVFEEVKDDIEIKDTGHIDILRGISKADKPFFMRSGTTVKGKTQERVLTIGGVLFPNKTQDLSVLCIHASRGISAGAPMTSAGLIPVLNLQYVASGNQAIMWSGVRRHTHQMRSYASRFAPTRRQRLESITDDDMVTFREELEKIDEFKAKVDEVMEKIPADLDNQVGIAVLDVNGVVGVETFDHEDSWLASSKSIAKSYSDVLIKETEAPEIFQLKPKAINKRILEFLSALKTTEKPLQRWKEQNAVTYSISTKNAVAEYTTIENKVIHFIATRRAD